jgi:hypothetical protein
VSGRLIWSSALAVAGFACLFSVPAHALRCEHKLISVGDHASKLLRYCGEPDSVRSRRARRALVGNIGRTLFPAFAEDLLIEEWTYNFGPNKLMRIVRLENGIVADIERLGYGFTPAD